MNALERLVYDTVKSNPRLKKRIRDAYQGVLDLLPLNRDAIECAYPVEIREGYFFGFHDKSPWSADDDLLLAHRFSIPLRMPLPDETVELGYFLGPEFRSFRTVGHTRAWNWHQGAMLQWVGQSKNIIFNDFDGEKHIAKIVDLHGNEQAISPLPVGALSPDGSLAASYSFARLRGSPYGYAYANGIDPESDKLVPKNHGLHVIDLSSGTTRLLYNIADIARFEPETSMNGAFHYFSHCQFAPSGRRLKFFHRWVLDNNQRWTRMFSCNVDGSELHLFPTDGMVSHVAWRDDSHLIAYARTEKHGDRYYLFEDITDRYEIVGEKEFSSDGHPSFSTDGRWLVTDTYPDRSRMRSLIMYDMVNRRRYDLARLYSPPEYVGKKISDLISCDLHPRWSRDNNRLCFDSAHTGQRSLCFVDLSGFFGSDSVSYQS